METPKCPASSAYTLLIVTLSGYFLFSCSSPSAMPHWLKGKWKAEFEDYSVTETWESANDTMKGKTRWSGNSKVWFETLTLFRNEKQELVYRTVADDHTTDFICTDPNCDTLVFVNEANDFPKRLNYVKPRGKKLEVWIDNSADDPNRVYFHFRKMEN